MNKPRVICLDDTNKPKEIKPSLWVKKDNFYTINHIYYHPQQKISGVELTEIELDDSCYPYVSFALKRFGILAEDLEKFKALLKDCSDLNDIDISNLIEEVNLELV
jgi:hypothetical protein